MSQNRLLSVLQLFDNDQAAWTVDAISGELGISMSTAYRLVRSLAAAGFLDPVSGSAYVLGPAFIRFDRLLRQRDPLIGIATPVMTRLLARTSQKASVLLCRRFRDSVMCVHQEQGSEPHRSASYERGLGMPLFRGATSKVILSSMPARMLRRLYLENEAALLREDGHYGWTRLTQELREIRRAGYARTEAEIAKGLIGIAAPITRDEQPIGSISLVYEPSAGKAKAQHHFAEEVKDAASAISQTLFNARNISISR